MLRCYEHLLCLEVLSTPFTAHECLLLPYEEALTRPLHGAVGVSESHFASSAHFLWIGERTRQIDHGHVAFVSGLANPIGNDASSALGRCSAC